MFATVETANRAERVGLGALFASFLKVSLGGFRGLIGARSVVVEQRRWIDEREFAETSALCELIQGRKVVGIIVCIGGKLWRQSGP